MLQVALVKPPNMNNIEHYVDSKVANLTFVVNSLDGKCSSKCPRQEQMNHSQVCIIMFSYHLLMNVI